MLTHQLSPDKVLIDKMNSSAAGKRIRDDPGRRVSE